MTFFHSFSCSVITLIFLGSASADDSAGGFWDSVYQSNHVVKIEISLTKEAWEKMQPAQSIRSPRPSGRPPRGERPAGPPPHGGGGGTKFDYVKARLTIEGEVLGDSGLRFKGNSSYRSSADGLKRPLKIDTDRYIKGQMLHGRSKFNLSNAHRDPAFMKEKLAYEVYAAAGLPTPGTGWAVVSLTVEGVMKKNPLGLYVIIEQVDDHYLGRAFGEASQNSLLMKPDTTGDWQSPGDDLALYETAFNIREGAENTKLIQRFDDLLNFIKDSSDTDFAKEIGSRIDLNGLAEYLAATSALASLDSYVGAPHNYYLMVDEHDQMTRLLPWDVNEAFGTHAMGTSGRDLTDWTIERPWTSKITLLERLFATEAFPKLYREKLEELMEKTFTEEHLFSRIATFEKILKPHLTRKELADFDKGITGSLSGKNAVAGQDILALKPFIKRRIASINSQLAGKSKGTKLESRHQRGGRLPRGPRPGSARRN